MRHLTLQYCIIATLLAYPGFSQAQTNRHDLYTETYEGNTIAFSDSAFQSVFYLSDYRIPLENDNWREHRFYDHLPVKLNGDSIYYDPAHEAFYGGGYSLTTYILSQMQEALSELADGEYQLRLGCVVVDTAGKIVHYSNIGFPPQPSFLFGIYPTDISRHSGDISKEQRLKINKQFAALLKNIKLFPGTHYGTSVPTVLLHPMATKTIVVAGHKVTFL